jgi:hypothetical protein
MIVRRGLAWLALATLLASGCDKTLSFDPPADEGNGGKPGSGGFGGNGGSQIGQAGGSDEPWQRAGGPGTEPPTGGTGSVSNLDCQTVCEELGQRCHKNQQKCVECLDDYDCEPQGRFCDRGINRCVQCTGDFACPDGTSCDGWSRRCLERCDTENNWECSDESAMCDDDANHCVSCRGDADCAPLEDRPYCLNGGARCVECASDDHCWREKPNCDAVLFECVECEDSRHCELPKVCNPQSHLCYDPRLDVPFPT